jgi:hypothetical protein
MSTNDEFSLEQSEDLIAKLKSGAPSEFEQLRSTLNLLAHVPELPPTSIPPVLPSGISQPVPILPVKSSKPRRTIVTSIMIAGLFASASLAAAAVTGIGPSAIVNVGHQAARFVKGVVGGVTRVVTGNPSSTEQNQAASPQVPAAIPSLSPAPTSGEENNQSDSEHQAPIIPALTNLFPPTSTESNSSHENDSQKPNTSQDSPSPSHDSSNSSNESSDSSHENQSPSVEDSPTATPKGEKEHSDGGNQKRPSAIPSVQPSEDNSDENSVPTPLAQPSPDPSDQPVPSPSPTDQPSEDG